MHCCRFHLPPSRSGSSSENGRNGRRNRPELNGSWTSLNTVFGVTKAAGKRRLIFWKIRSANGWFPDLKNGRSFISAPANRLNSWIDGKQPPVALVALATSPSPSEAPGDGTFREPGTSHTSRAC